MERSTSDSPVLFGLVGAGGFGRTVMPWALDQLSKQFGEQSFAACFVESNPAADCVDGLSCVSPETFMQTPAQEHFFNVAVADARIRAELVARFVEHGARPMQIQADTATIGPNNSIGEGAVFGHLSTVTTNVRIGRFFHCHMYSYVEHDCVIGDFVTFAPRVSCNGNVHIGDHAYIGTGAIIRQGTPDNLLVIGQGAVVGMGAVVTKDVPPHTTVVGNPARTLES